MAKKKTDNTVEIGFEEQIWKAADKLRGNIDASEYKNVVLGLIFLKYISDKFEQRYQELVAEGDGFEEDRDEYTYKSIFFVPKNARWETVAAAAHTPEIGKVIDEAMRKIEAEGKNAGEFYTPACIVRTLVEIIEPYHGRVYDPCCGSGGMFVQSAEFVRRHSGNINDLSIFGQESNPTTWKMATMNLAIRGIDADLGTYNADTFFNDVHKNERFDFILANPPFNLKDWGGDKLKDDPRWDFGTPPEGNANFAWVQHMVHHLNRTGRMGMVLANGSLSSQTGTEGDIRKALVEADLVEGIVSMPDKLFYSTGIPVSLWIITKAKKQPGKTLFIDAREMGTMVSRKLREFTEEDIDKVAKAFDALRDGSLEEEKGFSKIATIGDIAKQDFILTPGRYVGIADTEEDDEPFEEKMARLTGELAKCFEESNRLQEQIKKNLEAIGYGL